MNKDIIWVTEDSDKFDDVTPAFLNIYQGRLPFNLLCKYKKLPEHQGTAYEICKTKALAAYFIYKKPLLLEVSSLCFNAMDGLPGPYIKSFVKNIGSRGLSLMLSGYEDKSAKAMSTIAYVNEQAEIFVVNGEINGKIVEPESYNDYDFDACFQPDGWNKTFAQMSNNEKNLMSPRTKALAQLKQHLDNNF